MEKTIQEYYERKETEFKAWAQDFLSKKERTPYYRCIGLTTYEDHVDTECLMQFTDEEKKKLEELLIQVHNTHFQELIARGECTAAVTAQDVLDGTELDCLEGVDAELDDMLFDRARDCELEIKEMDLQTPIYCYEMSRVDYDPANNCVSEPQPFSIPLSDEEYLYLLVQQRMGELSDEVKFNYNKLTMFNPELAQKITSYADMCILDFKFHAEVPFVVLFDEVVEDAKSAK